LLVNDDTCRPVGSILTRLSPQPGNPKSESRNPKQIRTSKSETVSGPAA
jgi:hypothetical protein